MAFTQKEVKYCRGCDIEFEVSQTIGREYFVEDVQGVKKYHPIVDCDSVLRDRVSG